MFWIIVILLQLALWYLTFFKTKRVKKEAKQEGYRTSYEYVETNERFKFPLWCLLVGLLISFIPIFGLIIFLYVTIKVANMTNGKYEDIFEGNKPSFYIVKVFSKEI
jgi:RsiW-degrading membrane proteinase PrsW (M82 family)